MNHIFTISNETIIGILIAIIIILFLIILFWNPSKQNKATKNIDELFDKTNNKTLYKTKKSSSKVYRYTIGLLIIILFFLIFAIPATIYKNDNPGSETLFKEPPTIKRIEPENLGSTITFEIYAKANYDYVTIKLEFYKNDEFQKSRYLTETNLKKGNTYYTKYDFSLEEIIDYGTSENFYIQYKIDSFK